MSTVFFRKISALGWGCVLLLAGPAPQAHARVAAPPPKPDITAFSALTNYAGEPGTAPNLPVRRYNAEMTSNRSGQQLPYPAAAGALALFDCAFSVRNPTGRDPLYYALFYQNESSAFGAGHPRDDENFYGTWGYDEGRAPGFRPLSARAGAAPTAHEAGVRLRGNPRNEVRYREGPRPYYPDQADGPDDASRFGRWKRPPRMGRYRFLLVVTSDTAEIDFYARDCHRPQPNGHYLNPFTYFLSHRFARTAVRLAPEQLHVYMRPPDLGAPLAPRDWATLAAPEQRNSSFRHGTYGGGRMANVPVVADATSASFTPAAYNRLKHRFDDSTLTVATEGQDGPTTAVAGAGRIRLVNPAADPAAPHKYDASVRTVQGFTYGRIRARIRFPQIVNSAGVWTGINPAFWLFSASGEPWNAFNRDYGGDFCADAARRTSAEIDLEIFKSSCHPPRNYADDGYAGRPRHRRNWLRQGGAFQDEDCDSVTLACNNFDYMRRDVATLVNGAAATPPCGPVGNDVPVVYAGQTFRLHRDGTGPVLSCRAAASARALFGGEAMWYEIEWRPTEIIWRIGPDEQHLRVVAYLNDQYTTVPDVLMHVIIGQHWLSTNEYHPYFQEKIPYPAKAVEGEILDFLIE